MLGRRLLPLSVLVLATSLALLPSLAVASDLRALDNSLRSRYTRAHSLGDNYQFNPRDGWQSVNVTNLQYKYSRSLQDAEDEDTDDGDDFGSFDSDLNKRASKKKSKTKSKAKVKAKAKPKAAHKSPTHKSASKATSKSKPKVSTSKIASSISKVVDTLKGVGKAEPVTITWYTGHDLENPSCWPNTNWAPSDASFACALTLDGWTTKPKCFKFLELCHTPKACVFVRVVDSCAGCAKGSKHVDLTQAAFKQLSSLDTGLMTVQMRHATDPDGWLEDLWGPKA